MNVWGLDKKKKPGDDLLSRNSSTIGAEELNFRVRDGNGWDLFAMITRRFIQSKERCLMMWKINNMVKPHGGLVLVS